MAQQVQHFDIDGQRYTFRIVSGQVVGTDQRSDTHVWGGGSTVVYNGTGGGSTTISSRVDIIRDVWLKEENGSEHHIRIAEDVPVRVGQLVFFTSLESAGLNGGRPVPLSLYNRNVDRFWWLWSNRLIPIGKNVNPVHVVFATLGIFVNGLGIPFVLYFLYRKYQGVPWLPTAKRISSERQQRIIEEHGRMLREIHSSTAPVDGEFTPQAIPQTAQ